MCETMECEHYTPCKKCHQNRSLNERHVCTYCDRRVVNKEQNDKDLQAMLAEDIEQHIRQGISRDSLDDFNDEDDDLDDYTPPPTKRKRTITQPGEPPDTLNEDAAEYYNRQWKEYYGYFSDPTAMTLVHHLILEEIRLNQVSALVLARSGDHLGHEKEKQRCLDNIKAIRSQLPQRDAKDISDYEDFMSKIADRYAEEKEQIDVGGISRIFHPESFALAHNIDCGIDPRELLLKAGYSIAETEEAIDKLEQLPEDPVKLLEMLGYPLKEKFAQ